MPVREKRIKSGPILEVEIYPIDDREKSKSRARKSKETRKEQRALNRKNCIKHLVRLVNVNFDKNDLFAHLTYTDEERPEKEEQAKKDISNYLTRLRRWMKKNLPDTPLKYIGMIETSDKGRIHHHIIMSGVPREIAEDLWKKGRCNIDRLQPDEFGFEAAARYISEDYDGSKRRTQSKNLKMPEVSVNDSKFRNQRAAEKLILSGDREIESHYPGHVISHIEIKLNPYTLATHFYIKMRRLN